MNSIEEGIVVAVVGGTVAGIVAGIIVSIIQYFLWRILDKITRKKDGYSMVTKLMERIRKAKLLLRENKNALLLETEKAVLLACCEACGYKLHRHVPIKAIAKRLQDYISGKYLKRSTKSLISKGFIIRHPTRHRMTYGLSKYGLQAGNKLKEELENLREN